MAEYKLNIFRVLGHINKKDRQFYQTLTEQEQKAFAPLTVQRWLSGIDDPAQIIFLNELVNPYVFSLQKHKNLLYKLMTICTDGHQVRYSYPKNKSAKGSNLLTVIQVVKDYFNYSTKDAFITLPLLSDEDILTYASELGRQNDEIIKIKRELKTR